MAYEIFIHTRETVIELERESYYGGRVEMFRRNLLPSRVYSYVDINSAYPAVMANGVFPTKLLSYAENPSLADLETGITEKQAIAEVVIRTELPLFPVRIEGRLVFPIGEFVTSLATPELQRALREKAVIAVNRIAWYESAPIFAQWVDEIYKLRKDAKQKGDDLWDELLKRMMNSLFGKFGQRSYDWEILDANNSGPDHIWRELDRDTGRIYTFRRLGNVLQQRKGIEEGFNSFVAIAAHVTSAARMLLLQYIEQAQWRSVYYCDTDSLIIDGSGFIRLRNEIDASRLGALKLESQSKRVRLGAPKNYSFGKLRKHKGKRKNAKNVAGGRYEQEQFVSLVGALRLGWQGGPLIRRITKKDRMTYKKGIVNDDDSISPIRLFRP